MSLRAKHQQRAARHGPEPFLFERAFSDCLDRLSLVRGKFQRSLLIGCENEAWPDRLGEFANAVQPSDPSALQGVVDLEAEAFDLVLVVGGLDTLNDLPLALRLVRHAMRPGGLFLGAMSGGDTLPQLRAAMRAADAVSGAAAPHVHPRIEPSAVAPLLSDAGFIDPVVDVDRASASYPSLDGLIRDLRAMGTTNMLTARPRFIGRLGRAAAIRAFEERGNDGRTVETFEIIHFAAWTPKER